MTPKHSLKLTCYGACLRRPVSSNVNVTGLRTALWRGDFGAELPPVAVLRLWESDPKQECKTDRYQKGSLLRSAYQSNCAPRLPMHHEHISPHFRS
jgi:hypothetical protein